MIILGKFKGQWGCGNCEVTLVIIRVGDEEQI